MLGKLGYRVLLISLTFIFGLVFGAQYEPVGRFLDQQISRVLDFASGHPLEEDTTVIQKIKNDLGIEPWRSKREMKIPADFAYQSARPVAGLADLFPESELELYRKTDSPAIADLAGMLVKTQVNTDRGYSYQLLLVGFDGKVHKMIPLGSDDVCDCSATNPLNYFHVSGDPAISQQTGNALVNINSCGHADWETKSRFTFHHYLNNDGDHKRDAFWILDATDLVQLDTDSGKVLDRLSLSEIINANPEIHIFESRLKGTRPERWQYNSAEFVPLGRTHSQIKNADPDPFHTNDVDEYHGDSTGLFERGDLVLSFRSLNLLVVVRPASRRIIWYAYGLTSRQHDPDFVSSDSIIVYDNNFHNSSSRIIELKATASSGDNAHFGATRRVLVENVEGHNFQQLIDGYQFFANNNQSLIFTADYFSVGVDLNDSTVFLAIRHKWKDKSFLNLEIERLLTQSEFDDIKNSRCR